MPRAAGTVIRVEAEEYPSEELQWGGPVPLDATCKFLASADNPSGFSGPSGSVEGPSGSAENAYVPLRYIDRDGVLVDDVVFRWAVDSSVSGVTARLVVVANGTNLDAATVTPVTETVALDSGALTAQRATVVRTSNVLLNGELLAIEFSADPTALRGLVYSVRVRHES